MTFKAFLQEESSNEGDSNLAAKAGKRQKRRLVEEANNISDYILYDKGAKSIICSPKAFKETKIIEVEVKASLSDGVTSVTSSFLITYIADESEENLPPFFVNEPKSQYIII